MYEILSLFSVFNPHLSTTQIRQFSRIVIGLLSMTGRVSMLNLSRWTPEGGSYRTVQRFFNTVGFAWGTLCWVFFHTYLFDRDSEYIVAGAAGTESVDITPKAMSAGAPNPVTTWIFSPLKLARRILPLSVQ